jgi:predicted MFS family arabinose efflux permease
MTSATSQDRWASLRIPDYRWLWLGAGASFLSVQMMFVARSWLAWELTEKSSAIGGVYLAVGVMMLVGMPLGGVVTDRVPKRMLLMVSSGVMALVQAVTGVIVATGHIEYWMLIVSSLIQGAAFSFIAPARIAIAGDIVGPELLSNAVVLQQMVMNSTRIVGPAAAAVFLWAAPSDTAAISAVFIVTAVIMIVTFVLCFLLPPGLPKDTSTRSPWADLVLGLHHVRDRPRLALLVTASFLVTMVAFPYIALLPEMADEVYDVGGSGFGLLLGVSAVGGVLATVWSANRTTSVGAGSLQTLLGFGFGTALVLIALAPVFALAVPAIVMIGFVATGFQVFNNTLALQQTDPEYHGRVQGLLMMSFGGFGVAALPLGALADAIGVRWTLLGMGLAAIAVMVGYVVAGRMLPADGAGPEARRRVVVRRQGGLVEGRAARWVTSRPRG